MASDRTYVICSMNDIPSQRARGFTLMRLDEEGRERPWPIVVVRWGRKVFGYVNRCPHHGGRLDWERDQFLDPNGERLMCGKHGALFELGTGECADGPCRGEALEPVPLVLIDGEICIAGIRLAEDEEEDEEGPPDDP
ncbi:Rieske (2Fe-2S) protein [Paracraurococcus lichenis]|uniref:Rieske 2Fe-2S domain-containing protein n=1 Tax=Paracraurococcus lichenis TaxID=3064888 RepID=A0ABT9DYF0_9PROT|nr:Rieske 2Fe-2S domain-containing protein [Paracraurococcus sp. LOR1-02]MDO9708928.1 Rieske 2Fe-2S domain-containing protein [Paracraurococcus sp. LOR1-02]